MTRGYAELELRVVTILLYEEGSMDRLCAACLCVGAGLALSSAAGQTQITIIPAERHQTIEGLGVMAGVTWNTGIAALYAQPSFAAQIRDDLGVSMIRLEVPPTLQPNEDLDPNTLDWSLFDFSPLQAAGTLAANLNQGHPGAVKVAGSIWTPPWWMKTNGSEDGGGNLRTDRYPHFAKFCAGACLGFETTYGVPMYALSIQNEPVFAEPYESCVYDDAMYAGTVDALATSFATWHVGSKLFGSEDVGTVPDRWMSYVNTIAGDPVAIQRMDAFAIHHYPWANGTDASSPQAWDALRQQIAPLGKAFWQTERSGEDISWLGTPTNPKGALTLANEIHDALVFGDVTAYLYWAISDPVPDEFALMGLGVPTPKYYAAKQFFRFVRPGAVRVSASSSDSGTLVSAYIHDQQHTTTVVLINLNTSPSPVHLSLGGATTVQAFRTIRSSATENTVELPATPVAGGQADLVLPPSSVVTLYSSCYANCDQSTSSPVLNVADFTCFFQKFAIGDPYANCDGSTASPVLNVADFTCFLQQFGMGCQ
jgi:O-glycosyl hydrolase